MLRSAMVLDACMTLRVALEALEGYPNRTDLVVKRREGLDIYWYTFSAGQLRELAQLGFRNSARAAICSRQYCSGE